MYNTKCFHCGEIIEKGENQLVPLDRPYINLFFHKSCFRELGGYDKMPEYVTQSVERVYNSTITNKKGVGISKNGRKQTQTIKSAD
jgi:hypothetical protein